MNQFKEITVIEWKNGKDAETFSSDDDFREGTKTGELAGKTRIRWADDKSVEWVKSDMLDKLDNYHLSLVRPEDVLGSVETPETDIVVETVAEQIETPASTPETVKEVKPTAKPRNTAK